MEYLLILTELIGPLSKTILKTAAITRAAFDYQDLIGIEVLIDFYRDPKRYEWVELESEDRSAGYLDDVVALRTDGKFEYTRCGMLTEMCTTALVQASERHGLRLGWVAQLRLWSRKTDYGEYELSTRREFFFE